MTDTHQAVDWIERLGLQPHPEGGHFREVYRGAEEIPVAGLPERFSGLRRTSTATYYLLEQGEFSRFHRIRSDELWHGYAGKTLEVRFPGQSEIIRQLTC
jgi:predicted cupin superfamily sugar epimerase